MNLTKRITAAQAFSLRALKQNQQEDGSFVFCFESGPMTDAYMLLLLFSFHDNKTMIRALQKRLITSQSIYGYWKQFPDDKGHLSLTIEAYVVLTLKTVVIGIRCGDLFNPTGTVKAGCKRKSAVIHCMTALFLTTYSRLF
ncbi:hypothetical protein [Shouchella patagoniensis]|uniref:hypothetical protein n=1 Tax=Shouchella patagoniensis TaxID=228576 RepID=UPI000994B010|nr:hypothetical protein [Shouchella patagoniensis]